MSVSERVYLKVETVFHTNTHTYNLVYELQVFKNALQFTHHER